MPRSSGRLSILLAVLVLLFLPTVARAQLFGCSTIDTTPNAADDNVVWPGGPVVVDVLGNDFDPDGDPLTIAGFSQGANGTVQFTADNEALLYTPTNASATSDTFTYTITDPAGHSAVATVHLSNDGPPPPTASVSFTYTCDGWECFFTAHWNAPNDAPASYDWDFGDGTVQNGYTGVLIYHAYSSSGAKQVKLTIHFVSGTIGTTGPVTVSVPEEVQMADWESNPFGLQLVVKVTQLSTESDWRYQYGWDWGDGTITTTFQQPRGQIDLHNYVNDGMYTVKFLMKSPGASTWDVFFPKVIEVTNHAPIPDFSWSVVSGKTLRFDPIGTWDEWPYTSAHPPGPWEWDFGDGSFGRTTWYNKIDHTYTRGGTFNVVLKVTDHLGASETKTIAVTVPNDPPVASFSFTCAGRNCSFDGSASTDDGPSLTYTWNFGDGATATSDTPRTSHVYAADQPFNVTLTVSDGSLQASAGKTVTPRGAPLAEALLFFTVPPCRVLDTRLNGRPPLDSGVPFDVLITSNCGVPATAKAIAANVTAISPTNLGLFELYPSGATPAGVAAVNFTPARSPRGNNTVMALGANGGITIKPLLSPSGTTHATVDITGYWTSEYDAVSPAKGPMRYERTGVFPARLFDSLVTPPALSPGVTKYLKITGSAGIPASAEAVALNLTAKGPSSGGHLVVVPSDVTTLPSVAAINFQAGIDQSNGAIVGLGKRANDDLALVAGVATTNLQVDVNGWFAKDATYRYYPILPCRAVDTRVSGNGAPRLVANGFRTFQIKGNCGVPVAAAYAVVNATVVNPDGAGTLTINPTGANPQPIAITFAANDTIGNNVITALDAGVSLQMASGGADLVLDVSGYFLPEVNQAPVGVLDTVTAVVNLPISFNAVANDTDANGDAITLSTTRAVFNPPLHGTATRVDNNYLRYVPNAEGVDSMDYEIVDTRGGVGHGHVTFNVRATNGTPVANADTAAVAAPSSVSINVLANDTDPDGDALTVNNIVATPSKGTAQVKSNLILYTPNADASGTDTFTYTILDPFSAVSAPATVTVTISQPNRKPTANEDAAFVTINDSVTFNVVANDTDPDGDTLALTATPITVAPTLGTATRASDTSITYVAGATAGADTLQYEITDGHGNTARGSASVTVHRKPVAVNDSVIVVVGTSQAINVLQNDSDPDGDAIQLSASPIVTAPTLGTAARSSNTDITYTAGTQLGTDTLTYQITDAHGATATATLTIQILPPNNTPVAVDDTAATQFGTPVTVNVVANDTDPDGDTLALTASPIVVAPTHGTATRASNTSITYTATTGGTDVLTYEITDPRGAKARAKLTISVNRAPVGVNDTAIVQMGTPLTIDVLANDTDADGDTITLAATPISVQPTKGTVTVHADGRRLIYTPTTAGTDTFTYAIVDGKGGSGSAVVSITNNRAPVATNDSATTTNDAAIDVNVLANDTDADGDTLSLPATGFIVTAPTKGTTVRKSSTTITYTPNAGTSGSDSFVYLVNDGKGGSAQATVSLTIHRRPVAVDDTALVNAGSAITVNVVANDTDADGDVITLAASPILTAPAIGTATRASNTSLTYTAPANVGTTTSVRIQYQINDARGATASAWLTVTINRLPVPVNDTATVINNGTPVTINVTGNDTDPDGEALTLNTNVTPPTLGTAVKANTTSITYTPNGVGTTTVVYSVVDPRGGSANGTLTITIVPPNRNPIAVNDTGTGTQNNPLELDVVANDSDPDGDTLSVSSVGTTANGTTSIVTSRRVRFTPTTGYAGKTVFPYTISDGKGGTATANFIAQIPGEILRTHGVGSDIPVTGDWNGDGIDDIGVYRPSTNTWYLDGVAAFVWGVNQWDIPVVGDWNGDGKDEVGLYRDAFAQWFLRTTSTTAFPGTTITFGSPNDLPVPGDWNGDGKDEPGTWNPSTFTFSLQGATSIVFGQANDKPIVGDWNGDKKTDVGVYRPDVPNFSDATFLLRLSATQTQSITYGQHDDRPIAGDWGGTGRDSVGWVIYLGNTWHMNVGATGW